MANAELAMTRAAALAAAATLVPATALAAIVRGNAGALAAALAVAGVAAWLALTGLPLSWAARRSLPALQAVALGGFALRVGAMGVVVATWRPPQTIDATVLAVTTAATVTVVLAVEVWYVLRRADLWWVGEPKELAR